MEIDLKHPFRDVDLLAMQRDPFLSPEQAAEIRGSLMNGRYQTTLTDPRYQNIAASQQLTGVGQTAMQAMQQMQNDRYIKTSTGVKPDTRMQTDAAYLISLKDAVPLWIARWGDMWVPHKEVNNASGPDMHWGNLVSRLIQCQRMENINSHYRIITE